MLYAVLHPNREKLAENTVDSYSLKMTAEEIEGLPEVAPLRLGDKLTEWLGRVRPHFCALKVSAEWLNNYNARH